MHIGLVCPYSLTVPGGVQAQVMALARGLRSRGVSARVLAPCDGPPPDTFVTPLGNSIPTATNGSIAPIAPDLSATLRTIRALWEGPFDVLHLHEPLVPGPTMTALVVKSAPLIGTFHAAGSQPAYRVMNRAAINVAARLDLRVAVSVEAEALARTGTGGEYIRLFNGVDVDSFAAATPWSDDDTEAGRPIVLFVGRHEPRKGLAVLLEALGALPDDVVLWVAGEGPDTADLQRRHDDGRIRWLGRISDEERNARLRAASVFCAPALGGESFGIILLEAMAAGTAVVAADNPGYRTVARPDGGPECALLSPPGDAETLAAHLQCALRDDAVRSRLVAAGRARAEEFRMSRLVDEYLHLYERLARSGASGAIPPVDGPQTSLPRSGTVIRR